LRFDGVVDLSTTFPQARYNPVMFRKSSYTKKEFYRGQHRSEHWYCDNMVYFITSRCRDKFPAFNSSKAQSIFWDRFGHYTAKYEFVPWVCTLMNNHYHFVGYAKKGENIGPMMRQLHGSIAKLVNDTLPERYLPFWREKGNKDYFDGCLRDELQAMRASRYTVLQSVRAKLVRDWTTYANTQVYLDLNRAIGRAAELKAFLYDVPYARYEKRRERYRANTWSINRPRQA